MTLPVTGTIKGRILVDGMVGVYPKAHIRFALDVADGETITIGDDVYEFDNDSTFTAGNIQVDVTGNLTPTNAVAQLVTAINLQDTNVRAVAQGTNDVFLFGKSAHNYQLALSETMAGSGNDIDATLRSGALDTNSPIHTTSIVPSAIEISGGVIVIATTGTPMEAFVKVRDVSGSVKLWDGVVTIDKVNGLVVVDNTGSVDWIITDTIHMMIMFS